MTNSEYDFSIELDTYKSKWLQCSKTGCYKRQQKDSYPYQWVDNQLSRKIPKVRAVATLLGRKQQGTDFYRYYSDVLSSETRGKWKDEFEKVRKQVEGIGLSLIGKKILDVSGEPGFFASDARSVCGEVSVTAFADSVALAIQDHLSISANKYDFNTDNLKAIYHGERFDVIFIRYAIGFCEDLRSFAQQCRALLKEDGAIYISFSPASRAVCARWMFDDYTYLRQYTKAFLTRCFVDQKFEQVGEYDEGSYLWSEGMHWSQRLFSQRYTEAIFRGVDPIEHYQHNVALIFR